MPLLAEFLDRLKSKNLSATKKGATIEELVLQTNKTIKKGLPMKRNLLALVLAIATVIMFIPEVSHAQYRNSMFGLGLGTHSIFASKEAPSLQLTPTGSIGFESLFKMRNDHWWFGVKLHIGFGASRYEEARENFGVLMHLAAGLGVRYYFLTDRIRPFLQFGGGYNRIFYFKDEPSSYLVSKYMSHQNLGSLSVTPGIEFVYARNMSIQIAAECEWVIVYNDKQAFGLYPTVMFMFYM